MDTTVAPQESSSESHYALLVTGITILTFVSIFGTIGNIIVIYTILKERKLRIPGNFFIINLTVANIIITGFSIPVIIANLIGELGVADLNLYNQHVQNSGFCEASAYLKTIALHAAWYSLGFIALNRYYTVCRMNEYVNHFTKKHVLLTITLIWIWVLLINIPIMVGWAIPSDKILSENSTEGYYAFYEVGRPPVLYDPSSHDCVLGVNNMGGYTYANGFFVLCIPLVAIIFCYSLVYMAIVESRRKMKASIDVKQLKRRYKKERKISIMLCTIVIVFILCWAPAIVYDYISSLRHNSDINYVRLTFNWVALSNSAMNSILFAAMSKAFRVGYKRMLIMVLFRLVCGWCRCGKRFKQSLKNINLSTGSTSSRKLRNPSVMVEFRKILKKTSRESHLTNTASVRQTPQKENPNLLDIPKEKHHRKRNRYPSNQHVYEVSDLSTNEFSSYNSSNNQKEIARQSNGAEMNTSSDDLILSVLSLDKKNTFTPLLEKIDQEKDVFTEAGIYLGNANHRPKPKNKELNQKRKSPEKQQGEKEMGETWVNRGALVRNNSTSSYLDTENNENQLSCEMDEQVGEAV